MYRKNAPKPYRKKPEAHPIEHSGFMPYLNQFLEWSLVMNYSECTVDIRALHQELKGTEGINFNQLLKPG